MNNGGFLGFGKGAPNLATPIARYIQSPVYYSSITIKAPPGTKQIHAWLVGGGGGTGSNHKTATQMPQYHQDHQEGFSTPGGGGFGGAACFDLPVTTDPIVVTIGAGGAGAVGGTSSITIGGMVYAQIGGGAPGNHGDRGYFGGGGGGGIFQGSNTHRAEYQQTSGSTHFGYGTAGGEPPYSNRGGPRVLSWLYPEGQRDPGTSPSHVPGMPFFLSGGAHLQGGTQANPSHAPGHHQSAITHIGIPLLPVPIGSAVKALDNRSQQQASPNEHTSNSTAAGRNGWFGAGGFGASAGTQATPLGYGAGGGAGSHSTGGAGNHGGGGGGPGNNYNHATFNPFGGVGAGGSFPSTPHLWGLRTGQASGSGGAGLFTNSTTQNGGAGGGGAGGQNQTQGSQQQHSNTDHWAGQAQQHSHTGGGITQGTPTGGGGCAVFRFYI